MSTTNSIQKKVVNLGVAWEGLYGYVQGILVKDTMHLSGQLSHDRSGALVAPAALDSAGRPVDYTQLKEQMRQT
jgi:enamine deaminase RidA (YjgF/YER057c/UK114 family)